MKLELETIPVWDGVASKSECYICDLMAEAQRMRFTSTWETRS